ncbi:Elongator complex protein 6 [Mizuhopecten yessoensis]|uniref:Elongator complex protein 6 n=1 Tax=Mizuhopecten yessoensis TaxID=6573 RepID=A0A210QNG7_MIZYE|nr:Elongator complex protein 6 [Mizuhopecten yessoensis]
MVSASVNMFPELNSVLDIKTSDSIIGKSVGISESDVDGTFLIHHFLSYFLRNDHPVCFVTLVQSFNHFNTVSKKFGLDLAAKRNTGQLAFIEGLKSLGEFYTLDDKYDNMARGDNPFVEKGTSKHALAPLYSYIENICNGFTKDRSKPPVVIIDDISVLLSTGYSLKNSISLIQYLQSYISKLEGTLVLHINKGKGSCDEDAVSVWKHMCHFFPLQIEVCGLSSGYCRDVHGEARFILR